MRRPEGASPGRAPAPLARSASSRSFDSPAETKNASLVMPPDRRSQWEDTAFFVGTLMLIAGGGLVIQAGLELPPVQAKLVWGGVGLVWGAVLVRVWIFREGKRG